MAVASAPAVVSRIISPASAAGRSRLDSIDLLRGIVMVVMVLDHTRDFVHGPALRSDPTNLATTSAAIFMTRWITHFCAPVFVFLAGVSVYLQKMRGKSLGELSRFLVTRGVWLIAIEIVVLHLLVWFSVDYSFLALLQVIWVLGLSMICLAALIHLPRPAIATFAVVMIAFHNLLDGVHVESWQGPTSPVPSAAAKLWMVMHQAGFFPVLGASSPLVWLQYPLIPWVGVIAAGYAFGAVYELDRERRIKVLLQTSVLLIAAFIAIRTIDNYGDPSRWSAQPTAVFTFLSFINTTKYPPSLLYLLMTLGPALLVLAWFESSPPGAWSRPLVVFGRVPLFFYLLQWPLAHGAGILANVIAGKSFDYLFLTPPAIFSAPPGVGFRLWVVYVCWACIILVEYPLCRWFAGVKQRRRDPWLSYL
jgi:uncharacterized membrane protein